jgi:hypothetical protein
MDSDKVIKFRDLRKAINNIFDHLETDLKMEDIKLEHDYHNDVMLSDKFVITDKAPDMGIGQLYDDWEFLEKILDDREGSVSLMFDHVAPILRYIAYRIGE